jgi:hypothetical protein
MLSDARRIAEAQRHTQRVLVERQDGRPARVQHEPQRRRVA